MSAIRSELRQLCQLQVVDQELSDKSSELQQVENKIGNAEELDSAKATLAEEQQKVEGLRKAHKELEGETKDLDEKLGKLDAQLYAGGKGSKELTAIQQEIESQKARHKLLDEKSLELMVQLEAMQAEVDGRAKSFDAQKKDWGAQQKYLKKRQAELRDSTAQLQEKRAKMAAPISDTTLRQYETVRATRNPAVARVERGMCKGCRLILPVSEWQRVRSGALVQCSSCRRILCID
ncbi:MAG: C4-type zinc ribbon domain-containing protein [Dehalococcoidia bacterium]|nr:C4-type zinc ribbon domain-containing protein [Dehalococcoidia bacterium]